MAELERDGCFPGLCPVWGYCSLPVSVGSVQYLSWREKSTEGRGGRIGMWIQVLALCTSIVIN